jgi:hypothetical protein
MTITQANDNNVFHLSDVFAKHASSRVLAPVVQRPLEGVSRDGGRLPAHGVVGNYAAVDGKPHFLGAVSDSYKVAQMRDLCFDAEQKMRQAFDARTLNSVEVHDRIANGGAFVSREYRVMDLAEELREVGTTVAATLKISTTFDGSSATRIGCGTLDLICTNGMTATNLADAITKRHTKSATFTSFSVWLDNLMPTFTAEVEQMKTWTETPVEWSEVENVVRALPGISETKADRMIDRARQEVSDRGLNVYALTSAMTYYSSHDSDEFPVRRTGNDNVATTLENRSEEVQRWISSAPFQQLLAA